MQTCTRVLPSHTTQPNGLLKVNNLAYWARPSSHLIWVKVRSTGCAVNKTWLGATGSPLDAGQPGRHRLTALVGYRDWSGLGGLHADRAAVRDAAERALWAGWALPGGPAHVWRLQAMPLMKAACGSRLADLASKTPPTSIVFPLFFISAAQGCAHAPRHQNWVAQALEHTDYTRTSPQVLQAHLTCPFASLFRRNVHGGLASIILPGRTFPAHISKAARSARIWSLRLHTTQNNEYW